MLQQGNLVPDFSATRTDGSRFHYSEIWQRRNLLLLALPTGLDTAAQRYAADICEQRDELDQLDTACVVTSDAVPGVPAPGVLIADRWGEVRLAAHAAAVAELPDQRALIEQLRGIEHECPECQGEAR